MFFLLLSLNHSLYCQSIVDEIDDQKDQDISGSDLPTETIEKISASKQILILSNSTQSFNKGDFITLVLDNKLMNRAIVAKLSGGSAGIKIIRIYDEQLNKVISPGTKVKVIRGDDSFYGKKSRASIDDDDSSSLIDDEDDLFDETTLLSDDINLEQNSKRLIRTDNLIFASVGRISSKDTNGDSTTYDLYGVTGAFQFRDNFWGELSFNRNNISDFPTAGSSISLTSYIFRIKYTISAPAYSYLKPYLGFRTVRAGSVSFSTESSAAATEKEIVDGIEESGVVFGVTVLKRLVPGWFARLDLGSDILSLGFGLEF